MGAPCRPGRQSAARRFHDAPRNDRLLPAGLGLLHPRSARGGGSSLPARPTPRAAPVRQYEPAQSLRVRPRRPHAQCRAGGAPARAAGGGLAAVRRAAPTVRRGGGMGRHGWKRRDRQPRHRAPDLRRRGGRAPAAGSLGVGALHRRNPHAVEGRTAGGAMRPRGTSMIRGYAWARTLLAGATLLTLLAEKADTLFRPLGVEVAREVTDIPFMKVSLFTLLHGDRLEAARWIAIAILALTAAGWRPRVTGVLHWYVTASFAVSCVVVEGGDQAAAILTLLLLPVTLLDGRRWHWSPPRAAGETATMVGGACRGLVRLQMAVIYFIACTSKVSVPEWANGTAVYYWSMHPIFGVEGWRRALLLPIVTSPVGVTCLTW